MLEERCFFRFALIDDKVTGYIYGITKKAGENEKGWNKIGELNSIVVSEEYRNKGIAQKLIAEFIKWLKAKKIGYVEASCNVKNKQAIAFIKRNGLKEQHIKFGKLI